ncbi:MAG: hypothetical protein HWE12_00420 [Oceanospirillaceae bacterium]|nr:hypothetical protein [Oceanospirillaceae bacterium]
MQFQRLYLSLFVASALTLGPAIIGANTSLDLSTSAHAKGGNSGGNSGGGNGGGNSGSNGGSSSSGNSNGNGNAKSSGGNGNSGKVGDFGAASSDRQKGYGSGGHWGEEGKSLGNNPGSISSALGALNAAHASDNALANASANSRVGLIAAYKAAVEDGSALKTEYDAASENLTTLEAERAALLETLTAQKATLEQIENDRAGLSELSNEALLNLATELELANVEPDQLLTTIEAEYSRQISTLTQDIASTEDDIAAYDGDNGRIAVAESNLDLLEEQTEGQAYLELTTLEAAANKTLSPEVMDAVNELLDIESAYRDVGAELPTEPDSGA